ncbi:MAG: hypothetical protein V1721_03185 [Pseudomonadota bacterium]
MALPKDLVKERGGLCRKFNFLVLPMRKFTPFRLPDQYLRKVPPHYTAALHRHAPAWSLFLLGLSVQP